MEGKTLSITIPTYNRAAALDRLLANLAEEIEPVRADVEICVSDNCSSDDTQRVLEKWKSRLPLSTRMNKTNLGYDRNALRVMKMAKGKYLWHIGDDDLMVRG
jgi:glycosyltransferase involved in cell wall biosynthesis